MPQLLHFFLFIHFRVAAHGMVILKFMVAVQYCRQAQRKYPHVDCPIGKSVGNFLDWWLICRSQLAVDSAILGQVFLSDTRKQAEHGEQETGSTFLPCSLLQFLLLGSWLIFISWLHLTMKYNLRVLWWNIPFLPSFSVFFFITVTVNKLPKCICPLSLNQLLLLLLVILISDSLPWMFPQFYILEL